MEPFNKNKIILDKDTVSDTLTSSLRSTLTKQKKPVKFTWEGLKNFSKVFTTNPFDKMRNDRLRELMENKDDAKEKDYVDFFEDMEKSIYGGVQNIGYSFGDLVTTGIDMAADTNLTERLDKVYEENKIDDPETLLGTVNKILIEYGIPGGAVFKVMNRAKKIIKAKKTKDAAKISEAAGEGSKIVNIAKRSGYMATAFGATDFITAGARQRTGDEPLIMNQESEEGLEGRDLALARFRNKLRFGAEGTIIGAGFPLLGGPLGKVATLGAKYGIMKPAGYALQGVDTLVVRPATYLLANIPGSATAGKALRNASSYAIDKGLSTVLTGNPTKQLPAFEKWRMFSTKSKDPLEARLKKVDNFLSGFRSLGKYTGESFQLTSGARREINARNRTIEKYLESLEEKSYKLAKGFEGMYNTATTSPASKDYYLDQVLSYLKGQTKKSSLPKILQQTAEDLNKELVNTKKIFGELLPPGDLKNFILDNVKTYMRKSFSIFTNPEYMPDQKLKDGAKKWILENVVKRNKDLRESALTLKTPKMSTNQALDAYAESLVHKILTNTKTDGVDPLKLLKQVSKETLRSDKLIRTGEELPDAIKKLLGEENNLKSSVLQTTSHAITQSVNKQTLDKLSQLGLKQGWLFKSEADAIAKNAFDAQKIGDLESLGILKTGMSKLYATADMAKAIKGAPGKLDGLLQSSAYRNMLQFKVATQFGKTVLSPATQVRNVTSASMFPLANGHIGGRASVTESIKMVMDDIFGAGKIIDETKFIKNLENKIRLGVIDENIVASELKAVLNDIRAGAKVKNLDSLINKLANTKMLKTATRVYAGGDNLWKWYGHEYVKSQMRSMYKNVDDIAQWTREITGRKFDRFNTFTGKAKTFDDALDEAAAWQIRNTYPTYSKVPEVIKNLRKLPFGNFVSFPAEMIRTTYNILSLGLKEATSKNAQLRQNGYRRLMGALVTLGGAEKGVTTLAQNLTGVTMEQVEAYKRSLSAPWDSRAAIIPINKWKDGVGKAINFSYFSPYDVVKQPFAAALKTLQEGKVRQESAGNIAWNLMLGEDGPIRKLLDPFISEAIFFEKVLDTLPAGVGFGGRGGETKTGSRVYSITDDGPEAFMKSFAHIVEGVQPTAITTAGKLVQGLEQDIKRGGKPVTLQDELLALFSGIRIINVDAPKSMQFKVTDYNKKFRSVTQTEKLFSLENYQNRGPLVLADEFKQIQDETLKVNRNFHMILQDALAMGVPKKELLKILRNRRIPYSKAKKLLDGKNIPYTGYDERMKNRVKEAQKEATRRGEGETVNKEYFYPKRLFRKIFNEYKNKSIKIEQPGESELDELKNYLQEQETDNLSSAPQEQTTQTAAIQTPPLPQTPQPVVQTAQNINPTTGLTRSETALLSPEEQVIASRRT
jgi:hypothetical protein